MTDSLQLPSTRDGIPFTFFCSLVREISKLRPSSIVARRKRGSSSSQPFTYPALQVFRNWVIALRERFSPLPAHTIAICFRLLFPEEDVHRKYNIQEPTMVGLLADCFGVAITDFNRWSLEEASGCLGHEAKVVLRRISSHADDSISPITIAQVDSLLDELAAKSGWSDITVRSKFPKADKRPRKEVIRSLFRGLLPEDAAVLTQIILKDLKPLLYPLTEFHYTVALTKYNTAAVKMLTVEHAMNVWDTSRNLSKFYRMRASLNEATAYADQPSHSSNDIVPKIGSLIAIPKSEKGLGCLHALEFFDDSPAVWAETKYDGERAQIHVEIGADGASHITIFSKSKRDSTHDRHAVHDVIRAALGLDITSNRGHRTKVQVTQNVVLDAELVAFRGDKIEEFWRIRKLLGETAHGIRGSRRNSHLAVPAYERESMNSEANEGLSLGLVFFDVLYLNSKSCLGRHYKERRRLLEDLIVTQPGKAILANRVRVDMLSNEPDVSLRQIFAEHIASYEEGLVLKAEDSYYNDYRKPWVKLKKDYIPGYGDCVDLLILGAAWEKVRGRNLRVPPTTFTTFYIGALENKKGDTKYADRPSFHVYFTVSYGLNREQLEDLNFLIKNLEPVPFNEKTPSAGLPFNLTVLKTLKPPPSVILQTPLVAELFGAGFTKAERSQHYELRFPRMTKFHRASERGWQEAEDLHSLHDIARQCVGRDRSDKAIDDEINDLWEKPSSPGINCPIKRKNRTEEWYDRLTETEGKHKMKRRRIDSSPLVMSRSRSENTPSDQKVESVRKDSVRRDIKPLTPRTNLMQDEAVHQQPVVSPRTKYDKRLTVPRAPLTPPRSSPIGPVEVVNTPIRKATLASNTPPKKHASIPRAALTIVPRVPDIELDSTLAYFAKPRGKCCPSYVAWRKQSHRPVHSLHAVMLGCGWTEDGMKEQSHIKKGLIIIDECDQDAEEWKTCILGYLNAAVPPTRVEMRVYGCRSTSTPLYELT